MADWTEQDVRQIREWDEKDHPRGQPNNAGQFVEKGTQSNVCIKREEYNGLRSEVIRKQSQRGYAKKTDYAYTANYFYVFNNGEIGDFEVIAQLPIVGNEERIDAYWRMLDKK